MKIVDEGSEDVFTRVTNTKAAFRFLKRCLVEMPGSSYLNGNFGSD